MANKFRFIKIKWDTETAMGTSLNSLLGDDEIIEMTVSGNYVLFLVEDHD